MCFSGQIRIGLEKWVLLLWVSMGLSKWTMNARERGEGGQQSTSLETRAMAHSCLTERGGTLWEEGKGLVEAKLL